MIRAVARAHERTLSNIDDSYLPRIAKLTRRNAKVRSETESLLRDANAGERRILEASRQAQDITDSALVIYRQHLEGVRGQVDKALEALRARLKVAQNAYETISISSALASEMQTAIEDLTALRELHLPELIPFDTAAVEQRFREITSALEAE
jgi:hypothetical protein